LYLSLNERQSTMTEALTLAKNQLPLCWRPAQRASGGVQRDAVNTAFIPLFGFVFVSLFSEFFGLARRKAGDGLGRFLAEGMGDLRSRALISF
jgi:hypothetical protein